TRGAATNARGVRVRFDVAGVDDRAARRDLCGACRGVRAYAADAVVGAAGDRAADDPALLAAARAVETRADPADPADACAVVRHAGDAVDGGVRGDHGKALGGVSVVVRARVRARVAGL